MTVQNRDEHRVSQLPESVADTHDPFHIEQSVPRRDSAKIARVRLSFLEFFQR
jgi:hypothetical protein